MVHERDAQRQASEFDGQIGTHSRVDGVPCLLAVRHRGLVSRVWKSVRDISIRI